MSTLLLGALLLSATVATFVMGWTPLRFLFGKNNTGEPEGPGTVVIYLCHVVCSSLPTTVLVQLADSNAPSSIVAELSRRGVPVGPAVDAQTGVLQLPNNSAPESIVSLANHRGVGVSTGVDPLTNKEEEEEEEAPGGDNNDDRHVFNFTSTPSPKTVMRTRGFSTDQTTSALWQMDEKLLEVQEKTSNTVRGKQPMEELLVCNDTVRKVLNSGRSHYKAPVAAWIMENYVDWHNLRHGGFNPAEVEVVNALIQCIQSQGEQHVKSRMDITFTRSDYIE